MKRIIKRYLSLAFMLGSIISSTNFIYAAGNNKPIIETKNSKEGSSIVVTFPEGYSGKVMTECRNGFCESTSSPMTDKDLKDVKDRIEKQRKEMEDFFKRQQKLFDEMFNNDWMWNW